MKKKYFMVMSKTIYGRWDWEVRSINGVTVMKSYTTYWNRTQCRNVAKKFAKYARIELREV